MQTGPTSKTQQRGYQAAILALLILNSFTIYYAFNTRSQKADLSLQKTALEYQFRTLNDTLNVRNLEAEQLMGKNAELDQALTDKQEEIERNKKLLQNLFGKNKLTQAELNKAREMMAKYQTSIADMSARLDELTRQNAELTANNQKLNDDLTAERGNAARLSEQNRGLSKKVEVGSLLPVANLDVTAIKKRSSGKEVAVKRAKMAQSLKISFETGQNKVLDPGQVSMYVRIINPKGETIAITDQGSGTMAAAESTETLPYTQKADFEYNQTNKKVVLYWSQNIKDPGTYKVELYQNGYVVGQGAVKLS